MEEEGAEVEGDEETIERLIFCSLVLRNNAKRTRFRPKSEKTERIMIPLKLSPGIKR